MRSVSLLLVALSSSVFALRVTYPGLADTWTTLGPNEVRWETVSTDPTSFQVVLSTPTLQRTVLAQSVTGGGSPLVVTSPSGGFPVGNAYRINLISIDNGGILAESAQFNITAGTGTATPSGATTATAGVTTASGAATGATTTKATTAGGATTAAPGASTLPPTTPSSAASPAFKASGALLGLLSAAYALIL